MSDSFKPAGLSKPMEAASDAIFNQPIRIGSHPLFDKEKQADWDAHQKEMERMARLRDAAPDMLEALINLEKAYMKLLTTVGGFADDSAREARNAITRAGGK